MGRIRSHPQVKAADGAVKMLENRWTRKVLTGSDVLL